MEKHPEIFFTNKYVNSGEFKDAATWSIAVVLMFCCKSSGGSRVFEMQLYLC